MVRNTLETAGEHIYTQDLNKQVMSWDSKQLSTRGVGNKQVEQMMTASYGKPRGKQDAKRKLHGNIKTQFLTAAADCVEWQWFSKVLPSPCGYVHHGSMAVSQTIPLDGHAHSAAVSTLGTEISHDSLNLFTILWMVDDEIPQLFAILHWEFTIIS